MEIRYEPGALGLVVANNGIGADVSFDTGLPEGSGHGLIGMAERASALGGWLKAGPRPRGGFQIEASLPTEEWSA